MLLLLGTTDKIQVITASAGDIRVHASYANYDPAQAVNDRVTLGRANSAAITTAVTTDVVGAPGTGIARNVKKLWVSNVHASVSNLVTVQHTDGTNVVEIDKVTLLPNEKLMIDENGQTLVAADGTVKVIAPTTNGSSPVARLGATVTNSTVTAAKVTGLDIPMGVGVWIFEYYIVYQSGTQTTGVKLGVNHSGTVTKFNYNMFGVQSNPLAADAIMDQDVLLTTGGLLAAWAARAKSATAPMITASVDTINSDMLMKIEGIATVTVAGNLELYHASETAVATSVMADSAVRLTKIG